MALPDSHVFFLPVPQQKAGPLAEMDQCQLPSTIEQARKTARALSHLHLYVERCGGKLASGWDCKLRFRTTTRRNGRLGLTTDNYYYSPCGKTFRTHRQVVDFLGLPEPQQQPQSSSISTPAAGTKRILQVTTVAAATPAAQHCSGSASKRVALPASSCDSAATAATTPAAAMEGAPSSTPVASCNDQQQQQQQAAEQDVQSMPPPPPQPVRRTKAMLSAKYAVAVAPPVTSSCFAVSASTTSSVAAASDMQLQQQRREGAATPGISGTTSCSTASAFAATADCGVSACSSQLLPAMEQHQQQRSCKPSKPKAVPSWRANLRELASQIAAAKMASKSSSSSGGRDASTVGAGQQ